MAENDPDACAGGDEPTLSTSAAKAATSQQVRLVGSGLILLAILLAYLLLLVWSIHTPVSTDPAPALDCVGRNSLCIPMTLDVKLFMVVLVMGGLGSFVHTATSFGDFVGNQRLTTNWIWWYILRPFVGTALAAILYLAVRGGFMTTGGATAPGGTSPSDASQVNLYGVAAMSGLVGMFAKQATDKLSEVFDVLFKTSSDGGDASRKDGLNAPAPVLGSVTPDHVACGAQNTLVLSGSGFTSASIVRINGTERTTELRQNSSLAATLLPSDVAKPGSLSVTVFNPAPGGGTSTALQVVVADVASPAPPQAPTVDTGRTDGKESEPINSDGCGGVVTAPTPDSALPPATGGVAQ